MIKKIIVWLLSLFKRNDKDMPEGIQVFDEAGSLQLDATQRVAKLIYVATVSSTFNLSFGFTYQGAVYAAMQPAAYNEVSRGGYFSGTVTATSSGVSGHAPYSMSGGSRKYIPAIIFCWGY